MKRFSKIALTFLMLIAAVFALVACGDDVKSISVAPDKMPRLVYILGQDLDLAGGVLTVESGDGINEIPLDSEDVTVTGYDKNTLGDQTLTITYGKKTTTITVSVVKRIAVQGAETNYLVGESFNKTLGSLVVTQDNGMSFIVPMSNTGVSVIVDTSTAGAKEATISYTGNGMAFTDTLTVNVYNVTGVNVTRPIKTGYESHQSADDLDLTGGYVELVGNNGLLVRQVPLTEDMVSGFDPGAATIANRTTPLQQSVTVTYAGQNYSFTVEITYSDISVVKDAAATLSSIDWTGTELPTLTSAQGELAIEAMELIFDFEEEDYDYITSDELLAIGRVAALYANTPYATELEKYKETFTFSSGSIRLVTKSYAQTAADLDVLKNAQAAGNNPLFTYGDLLLNLLSGFGNAEFHNGTSFSTYLAKTASNAAAVNVIKTLEHMIAVYDAFRTSSTGKTVEIRKDWTPAQLKLDYAAQITKTYNLLYDELRKNGGMYGDNYRAVYGAISKWRENDDMFEILYTYYYSQEKDWNKLAYLSYFCLPGALEDMYGALGSAMYQNEMIFYSYYYLYYYGFYYTADSSDYMMYYLRAANVVDTIFENYLGDEENEVYQMYIDCLLNLTFGSFLSYSDGTEYYATLGEVLDYVMTTDYGYYDQMLRGNSLGVKAVEDLWKQYTDVLHNFYMGEELGTSIEEMLNTFAVDLKPTEQLGFLMDMNLFYYPWNLTASIPDSTYDGTSFTLDMSTTSASGQKIVFNKFAMLIANYYSDLLSDDAFAVLNDLMIALEAYSRSGYDGSAITYFRDYMNEATALYAELGAEDRNTFNGYFEDFYKKYDALYHLYDEGYPEFELGEYEDTFAELSEASYAAFIAYYLIDNAQTDNANGEENNEYAYTAFIAAYERMLSLSNTILNSGNQNAINAYYHQTGLIELEKYFSYNFTAEFAVYFIRGILHSYLTDITLGGYSVYESYSMRPDLPAVYDKLYDLVWPSLWYLLDIGQFPGEVKGTEFVGDKARKAFDALLELGAGDRVFVLISIDSYMNLIFEGFMKYVSQAVMTEMGLEPDASNYYARMEAVNNVTNYLCLVIQYYSLYEYNPNATINGYDAFTYCEAYYNLMLVYRAAMQNETAFDGMELWAAFEKVAGDLFEEFAQKCDDAGMDTDPTPDE